MKTFTKFLALVFTFAVVIPTAYCTDANQQFTAAQAYDYVQGLRKSKDKLVKENSTKAELDQAINLITQAISFLDRRFVQDLSVGNRSLFYRGVDARLDLAALYLKSGQPDQALAMLEQINRLAWMPELQSLLAKRQLLGSLEHDPRMQALLKVSKIPDTLYQNKALSSAYKPSLTNAEKVAGVSIFWQQARSDFAYFDHVPDLDWGATYLEFLDKVLATSSTEEYYRVLMQLAPLLKDGHTNIYPPEELNSKFYARPPIRTELIEDKVMVTRIDNEKLKQLVSVGDEIVEIDGIPVHTYAKEVVDPFVSSSTPQDRVVRQYSYQLLSGDEDKILKLRLKSRTGETRDTIVPRKGYSRDIAAQQFTFRLLPDNLAYISIDHLESEEAVKAFEQAFPNILKARGLIIDVRNNGGGSGWFGTRIAQFLTNEPIKHLSSYVRADTGLEHNQSNAIEWRPILREENNSKRTRTVFTGSVVVLTGARTFSAAEDFVASLKLLGRGKIIGTPTGGSTGQPVIVDLPGGGTGRICAKRETYADGTTFVGKGISPDVTVNQTLNDFRAGRDTVLERAIAELAIER